MYFCRTKFLSSRQGKGHRVKKQARDTTDKMGGYISLRTRTSSPRSLFSLQVC